MAETPSSLLGTAHFDQSVKDGRQRQLSLSGNLISIMTLYSLASSAVTGALRVVETLLLSILKIARWLWVRAHLRGA
jgi:hypothetical protein